MARDDLTRPLPVERDLLEEKASALARAGERLEQALAALADADAALAAAPPGEREARLAERRLRRQEAARRLWYLVVQREAIGLRNHEALFRIYRMPPELRIYAGPR